ncbi:hypothetical protein FIBSPDRAFT_146021 [Athelia psychrophila]|uniref:Nephrocystin 3-like N-terminal domain-containing protein n=1 Tax=Athelia psychrophila TaxID=1759441 RepID=A0A166T4I5_9AGAM|nr:hypothetical protein FIBSPDRAFT_146021 [Fibularhizoctonia sp. CBS 109695]
MLCNNIVENQTLARLGSSGVDLGGLSRCLPSTRCDLIDGILEWALHPSKGDNSNVLLVYGGAGTGKSAVAATVAIHFSEMRRLGAFVGFDRASPEQSPQFTAVTELARQLALYDERLRAFIIQVVNDLTNSPVLQAPLSEQFDRLIVTPLASVPALCNEGPIVIVLDSFNTCGQADYQQSLLEVLVHQSERLPPNLRFIITSRTVDDIHEPSTSTVLRPRMQCWEIGSSSHSDLSAYFKFRMEKIQLKNKDLQEDWPGPAAITQLTALAFGFFPWAVNASNFVDAHCPPERLEALLLQSPRSISETNPPLDEIYRAALNSTGDWTDDDFVSDFRAIMGVIINSPLAISPTDITHLVNHPLSQPAMVTIRRLGAVMTHDPVVQVLHPSFLDFLSSRERCGCDIWYFEKRVGAARGFSAGAGPATL